MALSAAETWSSRSFEDEQPAQLGPAQRPQAGARAGHRLEERPQLMVAVGQLVEVQQAARHQPRLYALQHDGGARVEVAVDVDDQLVVLRRLEGRNSGVEPTLDERDAWVV